MVAALTTGACAYGLHPRTTLNGRPFATERIAELREGQSPDEVRTLLGEPFFRRDVPAHTLDTRVTFRSDVVATVAVSRIQEH